MASNQIPDEVKVKPEPTNDFGRFHVPSIVAGVAVPALTVDTPRVFRVQAGKPITSHFLSLFKITAKSRRTDFETKWGAKERLGSVMARQTAKMGKGEAQRNR